MRSATGKATRARPGLGRPGESNPIYVPRMQRGARQGGSGARARRGNGADCPGIREALVETGAVHSHGNLDLFVPRRPRRAPRHADGVGTEPPGSFGSSCQASCDRA